MNAENFEDLLGLREKSWRHEQKAERDLGSAQLLSQVFRPLAQPDFIEVLIPMRCD